MFMHKRGFYFTNEYTYTVIRFVRVGDKFGTYTVVSVNGTLFEAKVCTFILESTHFIFNKCPIYTLDGDNTKFSTNSHGTDYSVCACDLNHNPRWCVFKQILTLSQIHATVLSAS
jgi:hypothetical protein